MALTFLQMVISLLFALSLFQRMIKRTVSTFTVLFLGFTWVILSSFEMGDVGLWIISFGLIFLYWRGMQKPPSDTILREERGDALRN